MARLQGISGGLSGKTGSYTFRQSRGQTIVSQYQPVVKNPNSEGQQAQRAKFKLMSQLAMVMAPGFGTMGVTKRPGKQAPTQRNAFVQLNMHLVEVESQADNSVVAKIPMDQVQLTSSMRPAGRISLSSAAVGEIDADFDSIPAEVATMRVLLIRYPSLNGNRLAQLAQIVDVPVEDGAASHTFTGLGTTGEQVTILAFGMIPSESAKSTIDLSNIHTPADANFISAVELNAMVSNGSMVETMTIGANVTAMS